MQAVCVAADCTLKLGEIPTPTEPPRRDQPVLGLWCERAQVPYLTCLPLPAHVEAKRYGDSLVNVFTAYAFLEEAVAQGHRGMITTAGSSATGQALAASARRRRVPAILLVRRPKRIRPRGICRDTTVPSRAFVWLLGSLMKAIPAGRSSPLGGVASGWRHPWPAPTCLDARS